MKRWMPVHERPDIPGVPDLTTVADADRLRSAGGFDPRDSLRWDLSDNGKGAMHVWCLDDGRWAMCHGVGVTHWITAEEGVAVLAEHGLSPGTAALWATRVR